MNTTKKRLTDDEFIEVIREVRAWAERDRLRTIKYQRLIKEYDRRRKRRLIIWISIGVALLGVLMGLLVL